MNPISRFIKLCCIFVLLASFNQIYSQDHKWLLLMGDDVEKETNVYKHRVLSDQGFVQSSDYLNNFIKKAKNNYFDEIEFWVSSEWGLKVEQETVIKQFDLKGNDLISPLLENSPILKYNELFGKNGIFYSGNKIFCENTSLFVSHPMSLILVFQKTIGIDKGTILDTKNKKEHSVIFDDEAVNPTSLSVEIGKKTIIGDIPDTKTFLYFEFNGDSSKVYYNGNLLFNGKINSGELNGMYVGISKNFNKGYFLSGFIFEIGIIGRILREDQRLDLSNLIRQHYSIN